MKIKKTILVLGLFWWVGCGGGNKATPELSISETAGSSENGGVALNIILPPEPYHSAKTTIDSFKVFVEGDGMDVPYETNLGADAKGLLLENLPLGKGRTLTVKAFNKNGELLRTGKIDNFVLENKTGDSFDLKLEAFPLVLNFNEGATISNRRLFLRLYADPQQKLQVEYNGEILGSAVTNEKGITSVYRPGLPAGDYQLTVRNLENDLTSALNLKIWEGSQMQGAPLGAGSTLRGISSFGHNFSTVATSSEVLWNTH